VVGQNTFTFGNSYPPSPTIYPILTNNAGSADVTWNKIGAFVVQPAQIADATINVVGLSLTNNSPSPGNVAWSACTLYYNGIAYSISAGNTVSGGQFITWTAGNTTFTESGGYSPGPTVFGIATNTGGTADITWNKIGAFAVQPAHIADATVNIFGLSLTNNSPSAGNVAWSACTVFYQGVAYLISAGNTTNGDPLIFWNVGSSTFSEAGSYTPGPSTFGIATNNQGVGGITWNKVGSLAVQESMLTSGLLFGMQVQNPAGVSVNLTQAGSTTIISITTASAPKGGGFLNIGLDVTTAVSPAGNGGMFLDITIDGQATQSIQIYATNSGQWVADAVNVATAVSGTGNSVGDHIHFECDVGFKSSLTVAARNSGAGYAGGVWQATVLWAKKL
jgi:hypothetical protein